MDNKKDKVQKPAAAIALENMQESAIALPNKPELAIAKSESGESQEVEDVDTVAGHLDVNMSKNDAKDKLKELKEKFGKKLLLKLVKGL
jgi:hypothetical protein